MIKYLYTTDYTDEHPIVSEASDNSSIVNIDVFMLADKYNIPDLGTLAVSKLSYRIRTAIESNFPAFVEAIQYA